LCVALNHQNLIEMSQGYISLSKSLEDQVGTWNLESQASCALDHYSLPNNVPINHYGMLKLIRWDLIGFPSIVYPHLANR
jgi:hypothetical protein